MTTLDGDHREWEKMMRNISGLTGPTSPDPYHGNSREPQKTNGSGSAKGISPAVTGVSGLVSGSRPDRRFGQRPPGSARWMALGAVAGPIIFTLGWLILGFLSPGYTLWGVRIAPYSPISQAISGLGLGPTAPYMNTIFVLSGILMLVGVAGILGSPGTMLSPRGRRTVLLLLGLPALGVMMDGVFTLRSSHLHYLGFSVALTCIAGYPACGLLLRRVTGWRRIGSWLIAGGPVTLAFTVLFFATFSPTAKGAETGIAGLTERLLVIELMAWYAALGWHAFAAWIPGPARQSA
jgi:Protein of unknown function (DUF998)